MMFRVITVVSIVTSLTVISITQRNFILEQETPPIERCYYYDEYGNYVHSSRLIYRCPQPEVIKTQDSLIMTFEYEYIGNRPEYSSMTGTNVSSFSNRRVETGGTKIKVEIKYTDDNVIEYYRLQEVSNYYADDYTKVENTNDKEESFILDSHTLTTNYYEVIIDTKFNDGEIIQNKKSFNLSDVINGTSEIEEYHFNDFSTTEPDNETEYRVVYQTVENSNYEFKLYLDFLSNDDLSTESLYEGFISNITGGKRIYFENEQVTDGENAYSTQMFNYTINNMDSTSSLVKKYSYGIEDYDLVNLEESGLSVLEEYNYSGLSNPQSEGNRTFEIDNYNEFTVFELKNSTYILYGKDYGYYIEQYGMDGVKDNSELSNYMDEIVRVNSGLDESIIGFRNPTHLFYEDAPIFDYNPIFKYMLLLTE